MKKIILILTLAAFAGSAMVQTEAQASTAVKTLAVKHAKKAHKKQAKKHKHKAKKRKH